MAWRRISDKPSSIWSDANRIHWRIYAAQGCDELIKYVLGNSKHIYVFCHVSTRGYLEEPFVTRKRKIRSFCIVMVADVLGTWGANMSADDIELSYPEYFTSKFKFKFKKKVYCCTRKYKSQFSIADINSHSVHGNGGKHAVCTFFICAHMLLPITYLLKNTDITQRIVCHAQQWGQGNPSGLMGPKSDTFNQVICSVHKGQSGKISQ